MFPAEGLAAHWVIRCFCLSVIIYFNELARFQLSLYSSNLISWNCYFALSRFVWPCEMRDRQELHDWPKRTSSLRCMHGQLSERNESIGACLWRWRSDVRQPLPSGTPDLYQGPIHQTGLSRSLPRYWNTSRIPGLFRGMFIINRYWLLHVLQ